jgi:hypothetical protein
VARWLSSQALRSGSTDSNDASLNVARQAPEIGSAPTSTEDQRRGQRIPQETRAKSIDGRSVKAGKLLCAPCQLAPHAAITQRAKDPGNLDLAFSDRSGFAHNVLV